MPAARRGLGCLGDPKIDDLRHRAAIQFGHQNVRWFQVAMDDALLVGVLTAWQTWMNNSRRRGIGS
jgi:hypothetical protein